MTTKLSSERATLLTEILSSDQDRAAKLLELGANEALTKINALGHDFTLDEIVEYGKVLTRAIQMSDDTLEGVAGGAGNRDMEEDIIPIIIKGAVVAGKAIAKGATAVGKSAAANPVSAAGAGLSVWNLVRN